MLMPKRVKYRKQQRGRMRGKAYRGGAIAFGEFGLQALEPAWLSSRQIEAARVAVGQPVHLTTDNLPGRQFDGKVTRFTYALDTANHTMLAEAVLDNPDLALRPGMLVTLGLGIEHKEEALLMPLEALVMEKTNAFAYTVQDNKAVKRPIKVGFTDARNAEVLEGVGLNDAVILAGQLKLTDGDPVRVVAAP